MTIKLPVRSRNAFLFILSFLLIQNATAQDSAYKDSLIAYQQNYINNHEVVGKADRKYISFYPIDKSYCVNASFKKIRDEQGFYMNTSSGMQEKFFKYGLLTFRLHGKTLHLYIYQSQALMQQEKYKDYLFVPFGDATSGFTSYGGGRYMDFTLQDIKNNTLVIDFNKAYNPYCAYTTGYNCPIPPKENLLTVAIRAGEKNYGKPVH
jgi:uncharacterized protein (DUF1684 family)